MDRFHRNLNAKPPYCWSYSRSGSPMHKAQLVYGRNVTIKQPSGKAFEKCLDGGNRSVFAWFKCDEVLVDDEAPAITPDCLREPTCHCSPFWLERIRFNPKEGDKFFHIDGERVDHLAHAWGCPNGECWGDIGDIQIYERNKYGRVSPGLDDT